DVIPTAPVARRKDLCIYVKSAQGESHLSYPATPRYMRVRIRRFSSVELESVQQPRKTARIEVSNRKCGMQSRAVGQAPGPMGTAGGLCREVMSDVPLA